MLFKSKYKSKSCVSLNLFYLIPKFISKLKYKESEEILSYLICKTSKSRFVDKKGFVLCPSVKFRQIFGENYVCGLRELERLNLIEVKILSGKNSDRSYSVDDGVARSFRLTKRLLDCLEKNQFEFVQKAYSYKVPRPKRGRFKLHFKSNDPKHIKLLEAYQGITVDPSWIEVFQNTNCYPPDHYKHPNQPIARYGLFIHSKGLIESLIKKTIKVQTASDSGRAFHPVIEMPKVLRPYIRKNAQPVVSIDAKSFHPFLIASCINDKTDQERYLEFVRGGFYEIFVDATHSRDKIKESLQKYLSGKTNDPKALEIGSWYEKNFPDVALKMIALKKRRKTFQMYLQQMESSIFVDEVFMKAPFWNIPIHDGICVLQKDFDEASEFVHKACESRLGFRIQLG